MPNINLLLVPTFLIAIALFAAGLWLGRRRRSARAVAICAAIGAALSLPAVLFAAYYGHVLDRAAWFYAFRAFPFSELAAAGLGLAAGFAAGMLDRTPFVKSSRLFSRLVPALLLFLALLLIFVPYSKPVIAPLRVELQDHWANGVCIQTTPSTCGPSSAATILAYFGVHATERELARECFTTGTGTENWYIARALRRRGVESSVRIVAAQPARLPYPSIVGTQLGGRGGAGHFIAILGEQDGRYLVGDPIAGRMLLTPDQLRARFYLTGFFMVARRTAGEAQGRPIDRLQDPQDPYNLHGKVQVLHYRSTVLRSTRRLHVYTPPGYDPKRARPYPVLYLLHGSPGDDANWANYGNLQSTLDRLIVTGPCVPFVVVMPDCEIPRRRFGPHGFEHEMLQSLMPWIESRYHVRRDAPGRAIAGFSMGGFQSITVGLGHLDSFSWIGVFSAGLRPGFATEADLAAVAADPQAARSRLKLLYVRIGQRDFFLPDARRFHAWLMKRDIPCVYQEVPGTHEWPVWQACLEDFAPRIFRN